MFRRLRPCAKASAVLMALLPTVAEANQDEATQLSFTLQGNQPTMLLQEVEDAESVDASSGPMSFSINYTYMTDYIFRGVNFSEFRGEGSEDGNNQLDVVFEFSLGDYGSIGFETWFEWYASQNEINPNAGGNNLQEVNFILWWSYELAAINTNLSIGWTYFLFPNSVEGLRTDASRANNNDDRTHEWWISLEHNDAWMWKWLWPDNEDGVLNPSFFYAMDIGIGSGTAQWMELGLSHEFAVSDRMTVTPSWVLGIDHNFYHYFGGSSPSTRFATMTWGLDVSYDLTPTFNLSDGSLSLNGMLYFSDALGTAEDNGVIQDEFFGGFGVTYSIGG